jgi:tryptophan halogenase
MIKRVVVLGGGSAGLLAALTLRRKIPSLEVSVVRSPEIGVIGVGEGTTPFFPTHLFDYLGIDRGAFHSAAQPTWKMGLRFLWGPRPEFYYTFTNQFDQHWRELPRPHGYYCRDDALNLDPVAALAHAGRAFPNRGDGWPRILHGHYAFHIENQKLVACLENLASAAGIIIRDATVSRAEREGESIRALALESGERIEADLFVDASGFRSELVGRTLEEPFLDYGGMLFCDRAVIGGWPRGAEPILPYTTAETMHAGWCWQIEHEHWINRGYVYSSEFISDEDARAEFLNSNPLAAADGRLPRVVRFRSGRYRRAWIGNVVAIGNACGFVEPLEATAIAVVLFAARSLVDVLGESSLAPQPSGIALYNRSTAELWEDIRDFLGLHYRFNTRIDTPFWQHCQREISIPNLDPLLEFYREHGPSGLARHLLPHGHNLFSLEGYLAMLVGQNVAYRSAHEPSAEEWSRWNSLRQENARIARSGFDISQCLAAIRHPVWQWS